MSNAVLTFDDAKARANHYAAQVEGVGAVVMWWQRWLDAVNIFAEVSRPHDRTRGWVWASHANYEDIQS